MVIIQYSESYVYETLTGKEMTLIKTSLKRHHGYDPRLFEVAVKFRV